MVVQFKILQKKVLHLIVHLFNIILKILKHLMQTQPLELRTKITKLGEVHVVTMVKKDLHIFGRKLEDIVPFQLM